MVAAVCSECQSHPEHPEVSLSEKLRFWEFVFKLFYLTVAFFTVDYKMSSVHADGLTAGSRWRARTFVLTAVVHTCTCWCCVPFPAPVCTLQSRGATAAYVRAPNLAVSSLPRCKSQWNHTCKKKVLQLAAWDSQHTHTWQPCCSHTQSGQAMAGVIRCVHSTPTGVRTSGSLQMGSSSQSGCSSNCQSHTGRKEREKDAGQEPTQLAKPGKCTHLLPRRFSTAFAVLKCWA